MAADDLPTDPTRAVRSGADGFRAARAALATSEQRLAATVAGLGDQACREPSALPGWTRGHLVTHLARNADGLRNLAAWAATGVPAPMYAPGDARDRDIEAGAGRPAADLRSDLAAAADRLAAALADLPPDRLAAEVRLRNGRAVPARALPVLRRREVEIHHVDLLVGYRPADWPADFVRTTLDALAPDAATDRQTGARVLRSPAGGSWPVGGEGPDLVGEPGALLAWLVGRGAGAGLTAQPPGPVPPPPAWV